VYGGVPALRQDRAAGVRVLRAAVLSAVGLRERYRWAVGSRGHMSANFNKGSIAMSGVRQR